MSKKIAIIGGGAAGMMAAATLVEKILRPSDTSLTKEEQIEVHLFEKNSSLGAKVIISGGGRCNVTTGYYRKQDLESKYVRGAKWLREAIGQFGPRKIYQWFEDHGVPLKTEKDMRVFPVSDDGKDIVGVFLSLLGSHPDGGRIQSRKKSVQVHYKTGIEKIEYIGGDSSTTLSLRSEGRETAGHKQSSSGGHGNGGKFLLHTSQGEFMADAVIIATGGNAYSHTGSTGDAYDWARSLGHQVTPLGPSLNSFLSRDKRAHDLSGIAFQNAKLSVTLSSGGGTTKDLGDKGRVDGLDPSPQEDSFHSACHSGGKIKKEAIGPVLLTHFGLTGPATFIVAAYSAFETIDGNHPLEISLSVDASKSSADWHALLLQASKDSSRKQIATILKQYLPERVISAWNTHVFASQLDQEVGLLSKDLRGNIVEMLTAWKFIIVGRRAGDEFVTAGGVSLEEVNPKTMMSKIVPGLFFAGEVLDVDGVTGGYNLTSSWATGRLAGEKSMEWLDILYYELKDSVGLYSDQGIDPDDILGALEKLHS